jgi:hypothetical protein
VFYQLRRLLLIVILWPLGLVAQDSTTFTPPTPMRDLLWTRSISEPPWAQDAWNYVLSCSHKRPRKHHGLHELTWQVGNVVEAYLKSTNYNEYVSAFYYADTITIDTGWVTEQVVTAHELFHYINGPVPKAVEHPDFPMAFPCRLMAWQYPDQQEGSYKIPSSRGFIIRMNRIVREAAPFDTLPTPTPGEGP